MADKVIASGKDQWLISCGCILDKASTLAVPSFSQKATRLRADSLYERIVHGSLQPARSSRPSGFVNVWQAKELILQRFPCIVSRGRKRSNVAAGVVNALLFEGDPERSRMSRVGELSARR
jgi:hypothetical protein